MQSKQNSETDLLIKSSSTSSSDEVEFLNLPTGTFSRGADILYGSGNFLTLAQPRPGFSDLIQKARRHLVRRKNKKQAKQAIDLLEAIGDIVKEYPDLDISGIRMATAEDNSISLSWSAKRTLFGAAIRSNTKESSWFLVQGDGERGYKADGYLSELDYEIQLPAQIQIVINTLLRQ